MDDSTHTLANSADALARLRISASSNQPSPAGQLLGSAARRSRQRRLAPSSDGPSSDDSSDDESADDATQADTRGHEATETTGGDASPGDLTVRDLATAPSSVAPASPLSPWRRRAARARGRPLAVSDRARREAAEASRDPSLWSRPINSDSSVDDETPPDPPQTTSRRVSRSIQSRALETRYTRGRRRPQPIGYRRVDTEGRQVSVEGVEVRLAASRARCVYFTSRTGNQTDSSCFVHSQCSSSATPPSG
jgi:hypothetical protein